MSEHEKFADDLPLLALGALEGPARDAVEAHARSCDQCSRELHRLNADLSMLALTTPLQQPPDRAKTRLMTAIAKEPKTVAITSTPQRARWWMLIPTAVSVGLLILVFALAMQNRMMHRELTAATRDSVQARDQAARAVDMMRMLTGYDSDAVRVTLVATNAKPQPTGRAVYSPKTGRLVLLASNFAPVPQDKAYQLWLIPQQGAPIPAGVFKPDAKGTATMMLPSMPKDVQTKAFAITIEPAGGSATPTMPIMLMGQSS
jgi:anti-sigma-K factor RskA